MKILTPMAVCAALAAVLFVLVLVTPWYSISFHSEGRVVNTQSGLPLAHGEADAREDYYLLKQVNSTRGTVRYKLDIVHEWDDTRSQGYLGGGGFRSLFVVQFILVMVEVLLFLGNGVLLTLAALGKMKKAVLVLGLAMFVMMMVASSVFLPIALPPRIEEDPANHLPESVRPELNESNNAFVPYGVSPRAVNRTIDDVMDVEYAGGLYGSDDSETEFAVSGGYFESESVLKWNPSVGWFSHVLIGVMGVLIFLMSFKLKMGGKDGPQDALEYDEYY